MNRINFIRSYPFVHSKHEPGMLRQSSKRQYVLRHFIHNVRAHCR